MCVLNLTSYVCFEPEASQNAALHLIGPSRKNVIFRKECLEKNSEDVVVLWMSCKDPCPLEKAIDWKEWKACKESGRMTM